MLCHACKEVETVKQIKAGCGCLVYTCEECLEDANSIRHAKCSKHGGALTNAEDEKKNWGEYIDSTMSQFDDLHDDYYGFDDEEPRFRDDLQLAAQFDEDSYT